MSPRPPALPRRPNGSRVALRRPCTARRDQAARPPLLRLGGLVTQMAAERTSSAGDHQMAKPHRPTASNTCGESYQIAVWPSSSRRASSRRAKITGKALAALASPMALRATLTVIFLGKISAPIRRTDLSRLGHPLTLKRQTEEPRGYQKNRQNGLLPHSVMLQLPSCSCRSRQAISSPDQPSS